MTGVTGGFFSQECLLFLYMKLRVILLLILFAKDFTQNQHFLVANRKGKLQFKVDVSGLKRCFFSKVFQIFPTLDLKKNEDMKSSF